MAASTATSKVGVHSRSISLPSRSHPFTASVEEHLCRLKTSEEASTSRLSGLQDLYVCVNDLLQLPATQQKYLSCGDDVLCGSLALLDLCSTIKDAFTQIRASGQDLESSIRRREADVSSKAASYMICKKKAYKMVTKCFASCKKLNINKTIETPAIVGLLREVLEVSVAVFETIFASVCPAKKASKQNKWPMVFKAVKSEHVNSEMDMALEALNKKSSKVNEIQGTQELQKCLMTLDTNMQECEEKLDSLVRSLIRTRVSILNVLNH